MPARRAEHQNPPTTRHLLPATLSRQRGNQLVQASGCGAHLTCALLVARRVAKPPAAAILAGQRLEHLRLFLKRLQGEPERLLYPTLLRRDEVVAALRVAYSAAVATDRLALDLADGAVALRTREVSRATRDFAPFVIRHGSLRESYLDA